jgi:hypothetical protein
MKKFRVSYKVELKDKDTDIRRENMGWKSGSMVACLPSKPEALSSNPSITKKKKKVRKDKKIKSLILVAQHPTTSSSRKRNLERFSKKKANFL